MTSGNPSHNLPTCPLFCDMDVVFICFFLLNHVLSCFFITARGINTVAETLPPSEDLKEKLKAVEVDTKAPPWVWSENRHQFLGRLSSFKSHKISYPLVNIQKAMENGHRNGGFSHEKWWIFPWQHVSSPEGNACFSRA